MDQHEAQSRNILACLGDSSRFRLVLSLLERERCVTELAGEVGLSQSCTTRHLQYLEREGLVRGARQGKRVVFRLRSDRARVRELLAWVTAASTDAPSERVSGADIHTEGTMRDEMAGPTGGAESRRPISEPASDRPWSGEGYDAPASGVPAGPVGRETAAGAEPDAAAPGSDAGAARPPRRTDMEDWLL